ncbi:hypothetical protein [Sediminibacterium sp.]|uniref:hypothetical protein n=1 Tax=Sediminibacterium sp. TaxID=1917865 RepID=UPI002732AAE5|nr:hypothetical protein [Sediminibacterium sp.]MDP3394442.1 hypothetical protein [Sediminibacterium sp.]MDP3568277.1 hypothetical protein [Sediminibacterium sp.]
MKVITIIYTAVLLCGCSANIKVVGKYTSKSNPDFFQFNADSTFDYNYNAYHVNEYSSGRWAQTKGKKVVLNSSIQSRDIPLKVNQDLDTVNKGSSIKLNFETELDLKNYKCVIFINDTLYSFKGKGLIVSTGLTIKEFVKEVNVADIYFRYTRCDSLLSLSLNSPIRSLFLKIIKYEINSTYLIRKPLQTEKYFSSLGVKNTALNVSVSFVDSLFNYRLFNNEKIKIRRKGLLLFNDNTNTWWHVPKQLNSQN